MVTEYRNYIDGQWVHSVRQGTFINRNPADQSDVIGEFPDSTFLDVDRAVEAARKAYTAWRLTPAPKRGEIIFKAGEILTARKEGIAKAMTREMGKVFKEAMGDVQEGIDSAYLHGGEGRRLYGFSAPSELPNKVGWTARVPVGVAGLITPWNFPLAIPTWKLFPALVAGNTVVLKPASDTPHSAHLLVEALIDAGIPPGVVNLVHGTGAQAGGPLARHEDVNVVSFTGSSDVGRMITRDAGLKRVSLELGGKNAQIVMDDANLDLALEGVLWGAFGTTGQRCTATSRLILHEKIHDEFVHRLIDRTKTLKLGYGLDAGVDVGPLVNRGRVQAVDEYVQIGKTEAHLVCGGEPAVDGNLSKGCFYKPTIFVDVKHDARIAKEEIFGPVLSVLKVSDLHSAIWTLNDTEYGLSGSIYTADVDNAFQAMQEIEAGLIYINAPTIGAECHFPFGGVKSTGNGHREGGLPVYDIFTEWKTIFVDYSGRLQKAQIDNAK